MQRCFPGHYYTHKLCKSTGFKTVLKRHLDVLLAIGPKILKAIEEVALKNNISKKAVPNTTGFGRRVLVYFCYPMRTRTTPSGLCARGWTCAEPA